MRKRKKFTAFIITLALSASVTAPAFAATDPGWNGNQGEQIAVTENTGAAGKAFRAGAYDTGSEMALKAADYDLSSLVIFQFDLEYDQTSARSMLSRVNEFRTGSDAWYWNESNTQKITAGGLSGLTYDYNLEQTAMLRAAEISLSFSHTRPNGEDCFTAFSGSYSAEGENIAAGMSTMEGTFSQWKEENEGYAGQGHRRNMLSGYFNAIGIAHVVRNGVDYWVMELGRTAGINTTQTAALDAKGKMQFTYERSDITSISDVKPTVDMLKLQQNETADVPDVQAELEFPYSWGSPIIVTTIPEWASDWTSDNPAVASVNDRKVTGVSDGETVLRTTAFGQEVALPVRVGKIGADRLTYSVKNVRYNGKKRKPKVTVRYQNITLVKGQDYSVTYKNNKKVGTAKAIVTLQGEYTGQKVLTFKILPKKKKTR